MVCKGGVTAKVFTYFLMQIIKKYKGIIYYDKIVFVMDNAQAHGGDNIEKIHE